jgi:hypothetical protein
MSQNSDYKIIFESLLENKKRINELKNQSNINMLENVYVDKAKNLNNLKTLFSLYCKEDSFESAIHIIEFMLENFPYTNDQYREKFILLKMLIELFDPLSMKERKWKDDLNIEKRLYQLIQKFDAINYKQNDEEYQKVYYLIRAFLYRNKIGIPEVDDKSHQHIYNTNIESCFFD